MNVLKEMKVIKRINKNSKTINYNKLNDGEWECDNCNSINPPNNPICKCGYKNEIIERLIITRFKKSK